jgi:hypothetical protein
MENKEVWEVEIASRGSFFNSWTYNVFAGNAAQAEKRGLMVARKENEVNQPYCRLAKFKCYVY